MSITGCLCSDPNCRIYGCAQQRANSLGVGPVWWPVAPQVQHGCICPVGAEQFCKGETCPRRERKTAQRNDPANQKVYRGFMGQECSCSDEAAKQCQESLCPRRYSVP